MFSLFSCPERVILSCPDRGSSPFQSLARGTNRCPDRCTKTCPGVTKRCPAWGTNRCPDRCTKTYPGVTKRCPDRGIKMCPDLGT